MPDPLDNTPALSYVGHMTFDKAHIGDTACYAERTFGLRPAVAWSEPVTVTAVEDTYWGQVVTVSDGTELTSGLYAMAITRRATTTTR